ncbi:MAG: GrpB family protein [Dysgonomonas sp.]
MSKFLKEMTDKELWQLFPVIISEHKPYWKEYYLSEKKYLEKTIGKNNIFRINHIGSTSIPNLLSKPTIDILIEIKDNADTQLLINRMEKGGYIYSPQPKKPAPHMMFMKGYTSQGFEDKVFHIHIRYTGEWDEIYFRNYLLSHPKAVKEYGELKLKLKEKFEYDRDAYTAGKTEFIKRILNLVKSKK